VIHGFPGRQQAPNLAYFGSGTWKPRIPPVSFAARDSVP
jgi:hypothetical protein